MKLIEQSVSIISETDPFKKIELAGRTCYKSEANITEESSKKFYKNLLKNQHYAMLEHATFLFEIYDPRLFEVLCTYPFLRATMNPDNGRLLVSANLRAIIEGGIPELLAVLYDNYPDLVDTELMRLCSTEDYKQKVSLITFEEVKKDAEDFEIEQHLYTTMRFITDRGVTHEFVRHRLFSFAQESTRYVNYANKDMEFIKPANYDDWEISKQLFFTECLKQSQNNYNELINTFMSSPQVARAVLPNALKTELVVTGNEEEWKHFFDLRYFGKTGKPNPDMKLCATNAYNLYYQVNKLD